MEVSDENSLERLGQLNQHLELHLMDPASVASISNEGGPNWWIVGAILLSAIIAGCIALLSVAKHRLIAKKKAAHDYILYLWAPSVQDAEKKFRELLSTDQLLSIFDAKTAAQINEKVLVQHFLNHYELLAVAINANIIDENFCKSVIVDDLLFAVKMGTPVIDKLIHDTGDEEFFVEMRALAKKWENDPLPSKEGFWLWRAFREIPRI